MPTNQEVRQKWIFGTAPSGEGGSVTGSTGTGARQELFGNAREFVVYFETNAGCTCSYQLLASRTQTGPTVVLSSGTMSTSALDVFHLTGPWLQLFPRCKTINSTANAFIVELVGN